MKETISLISPSIVNDIFTSSHNSTSDKTNFFHPVVRQKSNASFIQEPFIDSRSIDEILSENMYSNLDVINHPDAFYVADLGEVVRQYNLFKKLLPRIQPFFAIKCNPDPLVIKTLLNLGAGFDCASKAEIQTCLELGADPAQIIYANPCKQNSQIRYAATQKVDFMTFDNEDELVKISQAHPRAKLVLRILADDSRSLCKFGVKFGASLAKVPALLKKAKELQVEVVGTSFHVGSGCFSADAFSDAVILARKCFDIAHEMGFDFWLLDVGGGFPGQKSSGIKFEEIAAVLGPTVDSLFPGHVKVIAEPGRFFVSSAYTLACHVVARRVVEDESGKKFMYYINDGVYGSFNCILFDHYQPEPRILFRGGEFYYNQKVSNSVPAHSSSLWGPTCDSMDCISRDSLLPELQVGDWIYFEAMGAYTIAAASAFNGFAKSRVLYTST